MTLVSLAPSPHGRTAAATLRYRNGGGAEEEEVREREGEEERKVGPRDGEREREREEAVDLLYPLCFLLSHANP